MTFDNNKDRFVAQTYITRHACDGHTYMVMGKIKSRFDSIAI